MDGKLDEKKMVFKFGSTMCLDCSFFVCLFENFVLFRTYRSKSNYLIIIGNKQSLCVRMCVCV